MGIMSTYHGSENGYKNAVYNAHQVWVCIMLAKYGNFYPDFINKEGKNTPKILLNALATDKLIRK